MYTISCDRRRIKSTSCIVIIMFLGMLTCIKGLFLFLHFIDYVSVWCPQIHCYRQRGEGYISYQLTIPGRGLWGHYCPLFLDEALKSLYTCILQSLYTCICLLCRQLHTLPHIMNLVSKQHTFFAKIRRARIRCSRVSKEI